MLGVKKPYMGKSTMSISQDSFEFGNNSDVSSTSSDTSKGSSKDLGSLTAGDGAQNLAQDGNTTNSNGQSNMDNTNSNCSTLNLLAVLVEYLQSA